MALVRRILFVSMTLALWLQTSARAQFVNSTYFDPSIESAGMGGGSVAVFWRDVPDEWANPALLGTHEGIRYSYGKTKLLEELADDVSFKSHRILLGGWGIGVSATGRPIDSVGKLMLDYGESEATDPDGNVIGTFHSFEEVRSLAVGLSLIDLISNAVEALGGEPIGLRRRLAISVGHAWKDIAVELAPVSLGGPSARDEVDEKDRGALVRITLLDPDPVSAIETDTKLGLANRFRVDVAAGYSQLNYGDAEVDVGSSGPDPVFEQRRVGASVRGTMAFPARDSWIWDFASPTVSLGIAWENSDLYEDGAKVGDYDSVIGQEISLGDALFLRHGFLEDDFGDLGENAWGVGAAIQYRKAFGIRFDWAGYPQAGSLQDLDRWGVTAFVDPIRLARSLTDKPTFGEKF